MFVITESRQQLTLNWISGDIQEPLNQNLIKPQYSYIQVNGLKNNYSIFSDYSILSRAKTLHITNCLLDLSKIQGQFNYINLVNCECVNDFINCKSEDLNVYHSIISIEQILTLNVSNQVNITGSNINYQKCHLLYSANIYLTITDCDIDLSLFTGNFTSISLCQCKISEISQNFKAKYVYVSDCTYNTQSLESIECTTLHISVNRQQIVLPLKSKANRKLADLKECSLDLSGVAENWTELKCNESELIRNYNLDQCKQGIQSTNLYLKNCKLSDYNQLVGKWSSISLINCNFEIQRLNYFSPKIISQKVELDKVNISDFSSFQTAHMKISNCTVRQIPQYSNLVLNGCQLMLTPKQIKVYVLTIRNCVLNKFSVTFFPNIKNIQFSKENALNLIFVTNFIKQKKITKYRKTSLIKRMKHELNRIVPKRNLIYYIQLSYDTINKIVLQFSFGYE
ncbi:Hypothetical_protein [Hexamita inflata]|uniref:Hypothetical_protein n=1 Tax=Hexamita inflata TaxID=28002 RepID=A0AA86PMJ7_9EUKA|nr:Hypothetical protein HINF_LOCUS28632 [Hexamita inflata]